MLTTEQLNGTDEQILDELANGRVTPTFLADQVGISREYAGERLKRLVEHGAVTRRAAGLYELAEDPRDGDRDE